MRTGHACALSCIQVAERLRPCTLALIHATRQRQICKSDMHIPHLRGTFRDAPAAEPARLSHKCQYQICQKREKQLLQTCIPLLGRRIEIEPASRCIVAAPCKLVVPRINHAIPSCTLRSMVCTATHVLPTAGKTKQLGLAKWVTSQAQMLYASEHDEVLPGPCCRSS